MFCFNLDSLLTLFSTHNTVIINVCWASYECMSLLHVSPLCKSYLPPLDTVQDFFAQVGHQTMSAYIENKHVMVRPTKIMNNLLKVCKICAFIFGIKNQPSFSDLFSVKNIWLGDQIFINKFFWKKKSKMAIFQNRQFSKFFHENFTDSSLG